MILGVVGGRDFQDYELLKRELNRYQIDKIISGGANGADKLAENYCEDYNIPIRIYYPQWDKYGKAAGTIRNRKIIDNSDEIIAFWDGKSKGTKNSISLARKLGKQCNVIYYA